MRKGGGGSSIERWGKKTKLEKKMVRHDRPGSLGTPQTGWVGMGVSTSLSDVGCWRFGGNSGRYYGTSRQIEYQWGR